MEISPVESQDLDVSESPELLVSLGNVVDLTLGEGGTGSESKRFEYN
jgi:hypothetical protein